MSVYLDNAATTPLDPAVLDAMLPYYRENYGNPSSIHARGRVARSAVEASRKTIADLLNTSPSNIFFTSGGTEGDNIAIQGLIQTFGIGHVVSTKIEHHAVLNTLKVLRNSRISWLDLDPMGNIDYSQLEEILQNNPDSLVTLMHANNETGNLLDLGRVADICREYNAYFHSDTVQSVGKFPLDLNSTYIQAAVASAHKFHGPKGTGFLYLKTDNRIRPLIHGGGQERDIRPGTENVAGIAGLAKALEISCRDMEQNRKKILELKEKMINGLKNNIPGISFNGTSGNVQESLYTVLSANLPVKDKKNIILFKLDLDGIAASGGSACASGALKGSHVIHELQKGGESLTIRFSFSKFNTPEEIDRAVDSLRRILDQDSLTRV